MLRSMLPSVDLRVSKRVLHVTTCGRKTRTLLTNAVSKNYVTLVYFEKE